RRLSRRSIGSASGVDAAAAGRRPATVNVVEAGFRGGSSPERCHAQACSWYRRSQAGGHQTMTDRDASGGAGPMADKSNFTPDEWKILLESVTMAGVAITAAEPSGLWGLLKESFAGGTMLAQAKLDPNANPLVKAVIAEFETAQGRSAARDG